MNKGAFALVLLVGTGVFTLVGCHEDVEVIEPATPSVKFQGSPDPKFVGAWQTEDGVSSYDLIKDGSYKLESHVRGPGGKPLVSNLSGNWAVNGDRILFKDQAGSVSQYSFELSGAKLTLTSTGTLKSKTVMNRIP